MRVSSNLTTTHISFWARRCCGLGGQVCATLSVQHSKTFKLTEGARKGFNGGSALGANLRAVSAWLSTHIAACAGGVVGILWQWNEKLQDAGKRGFEGMAPDSRYADLTVISFCDGAIAGLVAITPGSGFVSSLASLLHIIFGYDRFLLTAFLRLHRYRFGALQSSEL